MRFAEPADLEAAAARYGVPVPPVAQQDGLLDQASRDVARFLGKYAALDDEIMGWQSLTDAQTAALRDATCAQALFRHAQGPDAALGVDDGLAAVGPLSFSLRSVPRFSIEASELLAGHGLYARLLTVPPDPPPGV